MCDRGIHRRERGRQLALGLAEYRMQHLPPPEAALDLAACPDARAHGHGLLVRGVEAEEAQFALAASVVDLHHQLPPGAHLDFAVHHLALDLHRLAVARVADRRDAGLVLIAVRQVQRQIDVTHQAKLLHGLLRRTQCGRAG
ncbi:hypothetical protein SDC9_113409 [bioreactor metagenome]|uniref:Uncharacterized protein n=1 Tax=bioreactor metagenome TaxID=1076179 RepID=A0A645BPI8_9ZZZZ